MKEPNPNNSFSSIQEWEGYVVKINEDSFEAEIYDLSDKNNSIPEIAVFPKKVLSIGDWERMEEGDVFRWLIGYENSDTEGELVSKFDFVEYPAWSADDQAETERITKSFMENIKWK